MLSRLSRLIPFLLFLFAAAHGNAIQKGNAQAGLLNEPGSKSVRVQPRMAAADTCTARMDAGEHWRIGGWVVGNELYKNYIDPAHSCTAAYPYQVSEINIAMWFFRATTFAASVDVESVDASDPSCPVPGNLISISSSYNVSIPGQGLYDITIPLDSPVTVNDPFFAGFYFGTEFDPGDSASLITDGIPVTCQAWNIWDTAIGFVSLDTTVGFPGRLVLYASGIPGGTTGGGPQPDPVISFRNPANGDTLYGSANLWAAETSGSNIVEYVSFQYWNGSGYIEIGRDYSGSVPFRNGVSASGSGDGWTIDWDFSSRPEGIQKLKVVAVDTLGRTSTDSVAVYLEPTPPIPNIRLPHMGTSVCSPVTFALSVMDENVQSVSLFQKPLDPSYYAGVMPLSQFAVGDNNGNPNDNNLAANGEFGDYYNAPVAAAMAIRVWNDRGYSALMTESGSPINAKTLAERLATRFSTRAHKGTYDEDVVKGMRDYIASTGVAMKLAYVRHPNYFSIRTACEEQEQSVMLAISGTPGIWVTVGGFAGWQQNDSSFYLSIADPLAGSLQDLQFRINGNISQLWYNGGWKNVDAMITLTANDWSVSRTTIGSDTDGNDGWSYLWQAAGIPNGSWLYVRAQGNDVSNQKGASTVIVKYDCSQAFMPGDYNNDHGANLLDLNYLIAFIRNGGPAPVGGAGRADANCDNRVNIADIVYYTNYLFGGAGTPCR